MLTAVAGEPIEVEGKDEPDVMNADPQFRAMILLGINCGFGQSDCSALMLSNVDLETGWIDDPRPKTEEDRHCPLWPETAQALRDAIVSRSKPNDKADANCACLTRFGNRWVRVCDNPDPAKKSVKDSVAMQFGKLMRKLEINGHRGFYSLRHSFETQAGECRDQVAVDRIMGHSDGSMAANWPTGWEWRTSLGNRLRLSFLRA